MMMQHLGAGRVPAPFFMPVQVTSNNISSERKKELRDLLSLIYEEKIVLL